MGLVLVVGVCGWRPDWHHHFGFETYGLSDYVIDSPHGRVSSEHTNSRTQLNCMRDCEADGTCAGFVYTDLHCFYRGGENVTAATMVNQQQPSLGHSMWVMVKIPDPPLPPPSSPPPPVSPPVSPPPPLLPPPTPPSLPGLMVELPGLVDALQHLRMPRHQSLTTWFALLAIGFAGGLVCSVALWLVLRLVAHTCCPRAPDTDSHRVAAASATVAASSDTMQHSAAQPELQLHAQSHEPLLDDIAEEVDEEDGGQPARRSVSFTLPSGRRLRNVSRSLSFTPGRRELRIVYSAADAAEAERACASDAAAISNRGVAGEHDEIARALDFGKPAPRGRQPTASYIHAARRKRSKSPTPALDRLERAAFRSPHSSVPDLV